LFPGSFIFRPDTAHSPEKEIDRFESTCTNPRRSGKAIISIVPVNLNPYNIHDAFNLSIDYFEFWKRFIKLLNVGSAIAGTISLTWLDRAFVTASRAENRYGFSGHKNEELFSNIIWSKLNLGSMSKSFTVSLEYSSSRNELDSFTLLYECITGDQRELKPGKIVSRKMASTTAENVLLALGTSDRNRSWPVKHYSRLAIALMNEGCRVSLLQGPLDVSMTTELLERMHELGAQPDSIEVVISDSIVETLSLLEKVDLVVCNDGFALHLSAYSGTPTVCIMGGGYGQRFIPRWGNVVVIQLSMACQGCEWDCCFTNRRCLTEIPYEYVSDIVHKKLEDPPIGIEHLEPASSVTQEDILQAMRKRIVQLSCSLIEKENEIRQLASWRDKQLIELNEKEAQIRQLKATVDHSF